MLDLERHAQDGAQTQQHDAVAGAEALILLCITGQDGLPLPGDLLYHAARDQEIWGFDGGFVDPASGEDFQLLAVIIQGRPVLGRRGPQHDKTAFGARGRDDLIHNAIQDLVQVERRGHGLRQAVKQIEAVVSGHEFI